jgi:hypothetical protein
MVHIEHDQQVMESALNCSTRHLRGAIVTGLFPSSLAARPAASLAANLVQASVKGGCRRIEDRSMLEPTIALDRFHRPIEEAYLLDRSLICFTGL